jgi:hypothetical protein
MKFSSYIPKNTLIVGYKEQQVRILVYCKHHMKIFGRLQENQFHFNVRVTCIYHRVLWVK